MDEIISGIKRMRELQRAKKARQKWTAGMMVELNGLERWADEELEGELRIVDERLRQMDENPRHYRSEQGRAGEGA